MRYYTVQIRISPVVEGVKKNPFNFPHEVYLSLTRIHYLKLFLERSPSCSQLGLFFVIYLIFISMKLGKLYEEIMNERVFFDYDIDDDKVTIRAIVNKQAVGMIELVFVSDAYSEFKDLIDSGDMTQQEFKSIFPNNRYVEIKTLRVENDEQGKGYAKKLLDEAKIYLKKDNQYVLYLNASPIGNSGRDIEGLVKLYKDAGFETIIDDGHNVEMFMEI